MDRLISLQAAIDALNRIGSLDTDADMEYAKGIFERLPSAQPEIIMCKDCKHSFLHDNGEKVARICGLTRMCGTTPDNWYCADAERRTDEN